MRIVMISNTYLPHVGGVARSVQSFTEQYRKKGHQVLVIAPEFENMPEDERDVIRVPAIQNFNGSDFSVRVPIPALLTEVLEKVNPDIIHSHHPFLLGDTAVRLAAARSIPLVFTHHTLYEGYTHYVPGDSDQLKRFVIQLSTGYANLCQQVIAPSESVRKLLIERGVETPITVVPTGVNTETFAKGCGEDLRKKLGIDSKAFVVGHIGRLAKEKNLTFLGKALEQYLKKSKKSHLLMVGDGPSKNELETHLNKSGLAKRIYFTGTLQGEDLINAYSAMNVFAFASHSETQGMVLTEAMAAGLPVVGVDASGVREVIKDGINGKLLAADDVGEFVKALKWVEEKKGAEKEKLIAAAKATAEEFSMENCSERLLQVYEALVAQNQFPATHNDGPWPSAINLIETEWELLTQKAEAAAAALKSSSIYRAHWFRQLLIIKRKLRQKLSTAEWAATHLNLWQSENTQEEPGLVLIQIDGLSEPEFRRAIQNGKLPFLRKLTRRNGYQLYAMYSGLPSTTPAVQAELFYGEKCVVPSFGFVQHESNKLVRMFDPEVAQQTEKTLARKNKGLLENGSAYSDIYSGGATYSHFCPGSLGWGHMLEKGSTLTLLGLLLLNGWRVLRALALIVIEAVIAVFDCLFGILKGESVVGELMTIISRVAVTITLREFITLGASIDAVRGVPIIHLNFLGYDEQAHRRGPSSRFAHWTLKGIDGSIKRIFRAAQNSSRRDYEVWIYSDHGQEATEPYFNTHKKTVEDAIQEVLGSGRPQNYKEDRARARAGSPQLERAKWLGGVFKFFNPAKLALSSEEDAEVRVAAMGPLGHVYFKEKLETKAKHEVAKKLVAKAHIPLVLFCDDGEGVHAYTSEGGYKLPEDAATIIGKDHPYLTEIKKDLCTLCHHLDAGQLVISGWRPNKAPITFPLENGAHGGPGKVETSAFVFAPASVPLTSDETSTLRPRQLREAALSYLYPKDYAAPFIKSRSRAASNILRVMTYNVHACLGMDGRVSPARIARIISEFNPDVVALQELDVGRARSNHLDQAEAIARRLDMSFHFHPSLEVATERYGNAILSKEPMTVLRKGALPRLIGRRELEPRGALWVEIEFNGLRIHFLNTHLGLSTPEQVLQVEALLGDSWMNDQRCSGPVVFCGDLNAVPKTRAYKSISAQLTDVQVALANSHPKATWSARFPVRRIDHMFVSSAVNVKSIHIPRTDLTVIASDHLPLIADLEF